MYHLSCDVWFGFVSCVLNQAFLSDLINGTWRWIGLTDVDKEGTWRWIDGSPLTLRSGLKCFLLLCFVEHFSLCNVSVIPLIQRKRLLVTTYSFSQSLWCISQIIINICTSVLKTISANFTTQWISCKSVNLCLKCLVYVSKANIYVNEKCEKSLVPDLL